MKKSDILYSLGCMFTRQWTEKNPEFMNFNKSAEMCRIDVSRYRTFTSMWAVLLAIGIVISLDVLPILGIILASISFISMVICMRLKPGTTTYMVAKEWKGARSKINKANLFPVLSSVLKNRSIDMHHANGEDLISALRPAIGSEFEECKRKRDLADAEGFPKKSRYYRLRIIDLIEIASDFKLNMTFSCG